MLFTADQIVAHFVGDYLLQNSWMAINKTKRWLPAIVHAIVYTLPFLFITQNPLALLVICSTHAIEDRYYLVRFFIKWKNGGGDKINPRTGYLRALPDWLTYWLLYAQDNILHILINGIAIKFLG